MTRFHELWIKVDVETDAAAHETEGVVAGICQAIVDAGADEVSVERHRISDEDGLLGDGPGWLQGDGNEVSPDWLHEYGWLRIGGVGHRITCLVCPPDPVWFVESADYETAWNVARGHHGAVHGEPRTMEIYVPVLDPNEDTVLSPDIKIHAAGSPVTVGGRQIGEVLVARPSADGRGITLTVRLDPGVDVEL